MAVWQFTKEGDISNGKEVISFEQLVATIERSNSDSINIDSTDMGEALEHNDLVYINQTNGKFYKSFNTGISNQAQNVVGAYRRRFNKHQIVFEGLIDGFTGLLPGKFYYLSDIPGMAAANTTRHNVSVGKAINSTTILLDIRGETNINDVTVYDTVIVDGESKEGNGLTDPSTTMTVSFSRLAYDGTVPANIMFLSAGGVNAKIDYASEYEGKTFRLVIGEAAYVGAFGLNENYNTPTVLELEGVAPTVPDPVNDTVVLTSTATVDEGGFIVYTANVTTSPTSQLAINLSNGSTIVIQVGSTTGSITTVAPNVTVDTNVSVGIDGIVGGGYSTLNTDSTTTTLVKNIDVVVVPPTGTVYDTVIVNGQSLEGNGLTDPSGTMSLSFDKKAFDGTVPTGIMFFSANGVSAKLDFANEYTGSPLSVVIGGTTVSGVFGTNEDFNNPTILV
jgi:hypothetical protein